MREVIHMKFYNCIYIFQSNSVHMTLKVKVSLTDDTDTILYDVTLFNSYDLDCHVQG